MTPKIFIKDIDRLKSACRGKKKQLFEQLVTMAEQYMNTQLASTPPAQSTTYMGMAIFNLSLLYIITENEIYLTEAKRWIDTVISYESWGYSYLVNVDLSASWILFGLSMGYHYLEDALTENEKTKIYEKLVKHGTIMFDYRQNTFGKGWSTQYYQNHNWINMTGLTTAGYVLAPKYEQAKDWLSASRNNFKHVYLNLAEDGSDYEGVPYWHYGVFWLIVYADLVRDRDGYDYLKRSPFLRNTFDYKMSQTLPDLKQIINFGDAHDYRSGHSIAMYYKLAKEYQNGYAQSMGNIVFNQFYEEEQKESHLKPGITCEIGLALLWYEPRVKELSLENYSKYQYFPDLGLVSLKKGDQFESTMFSAKCSKPGGNKQFEQSLKYYRQGIDLFGLSHHHPDNTHFILTKNGKYYVLDDGYNRNMMMRNHNVVTPKDFGCDIENVMDVYQSSIRKRLSTNTLDEQTYGGFVHLSRHVDDILFYFAETGSIFHPEAKIKQSSRLFITPDLEYILIYDQIESDREHVYQCHFHSDVEPILDGNQSKIILDETLVIHHVLPKTILRSREIQSVKALYTPQEPNDYHQIDMIDTIVETSISNSGIFLNVLSFEDLKIQHLDGLILIEVNGRTDAFLYGSSRDIKTDASFAFIKDYKGLNQKSYLYQGTAITFNQLNKVVGSIEVL